MSIRGYIQKSVERRENAKEITNPSTSIVSYASSSSDQEVNSSNAVAVSANTTTTAPTPTASRVKKAQAFHMHSTNDKNSYKNGFNSVANGSASASSEVDNGMYMYIMFEYIMYMYIRYKYLLHTCYICFSRNYRNYLCICVYIYFKSWRDTLHVLLVSLQ